MPETSNLVRECEAARLLGVSVASMRRWRREGRGPAYVRVEGCIRYRVADLQAFMAANTVVPNSPKQRSR